MPDGATRTAASLIAHEGVADARSNHDALLLSDLSTVALTLAGLYFGLWLIPMVGSPPLRLHTSTARFGDL